MRRDASLSLSTQKEASFDPSDAAAVPVRRAGNKEEAEEPPPRSPDSLPGPAATRLAADAHGQSIAWIKKQAFSVIG